MYLLQCILFGMKKDYFVSSVFTLAIFNVSSSHIWKFFDLSYESDIRQFIDIMRDNAFSTFLQERLNNSLLKGKYICYYSLL